MTTKIPKRSTAPKITEAAATSVRERLLDAQDQLNETFVAREEAVEAMLLAHVAGEHYLLVGERGTGKTAVATCFWQHVTEARKFRTMLGAFTTPEKVFGPLDIKAFQAGRYETVTEGMLPWAELGFQDEVLKAPDGVLCEELGMLNEREYQGQRRPLHCCGAATNWPEVDGRSERVQPLYDRWLLRVQVRPLADAVLTRKMLAATDRVRDYEPRSTVTMAELLRAAEEARQVLVPEWVDEELASLHDELARPKATASGGRPPRGIPVSDRRLGQLRGVLRAAAWLRGDGAVAIEDFSAARFVLWEDRGDLEKVDAALSSMDTEHIRAATKAVDEAISEMRESSKRAQQGMAVTKAVGDKVRDSVERAREIYLGPRLTKKGKATVLQSLSRVKEQIKDFAKRHPGLIQGVQSQESAT